MEYLKDFDTDKEFQNNLRRRIKKFSYRNGHSLKKRGVNPRKLGTNPRALKDNPRIVKAIIISEGEICPNCKVAMQRRKHPVITKKLKRQPYYFSEWDFCPSCKHLQHYDAFKVFTNSEYSHVLQEEERQRSFFRDM